MQPAGTGSSIAVDAAAQAARPSAEPGFLGVVIARTSVDLAATFDSRLESVDVRMGDRVRRDARLATLDVRSAQQDLLIAEAAVRSVEAEHDQAVLELADAKSRLERLTRLSDLVSSEQVATGRYQEQLAAARLDRARAQVGERGARVNQLREVIDDAEIRAPFDGIVAARYFDPGSTVVRGTPILRVISPGALWVRFAVPEARAAQVAVGRHVLVRLESPVMMLSGTVENVAPEIDNALQMLVVEAAIAAAPELLNQVPSGAIARVTVDAPPRSAPR